MAELPTATDFFGQAQKPPPQAAPDASIPTARDFFGSSDQMVGNYSGPAPDTIWSSTYDAGARVLNAIGYGATSHWGSEPLGFSPESEAALRKAGVFNDYAIGNTNFLKSVNEALLRPTVATADLAMRTLAAGAYGVAYGAKQIEQENQATLDKGNATLRAEGLPGFLPNPHVAGMIGELAGSLPEGGILPEQAPHLAEVQRARALGVIGEGEKGFHDAEPVSPENVQARTQAAKESGLPPHEPVPPPDIHTLARQIDPTTFEKYDALVAQRQHYGAAVEGLADEYERSPEVVEAHEHVERILDSINGEESRFTPEQRNELDAAEQHLDNLLRSQTPEMREAQFRYTDLGQQMQPLYERVQSAYRRAQEMLPEPELGAATAEAEKGAEEAQKPGAEKEADQAQAVPSAVQHGLEEPHMAPPQVMVPQAEAGDVSPPNVVGEQTLGAPEEATKPTRYGAPRPIKGTGETVARGVSQGIEAKAIEQGLTTSFGDLPEYQRVSMADQAQKALNYIAKDYEAAKAVAMGQKAPPRNLLPTSVLVAVEKRALAEGDVETLRRLATQSSLSGQITTMAQNIRTLAERDPASPVGAIAEVQRAREEAFKAREKTDIPTAKAQAVAEAKTEIRKSAKSASKDSWNSLIESLKC